MSVDPEILAYYERGFERDRLTSGRQRIEFLRIQDLLRRYLPVTSAADRAAALAEARRVTRPGGTVVAKALSRFYPVFEDFAAGLQSSPGWLERTTRFLADGQYRNPGGDPSRFTTGYFHRPEELIREVADAGLELVAFVAPSGIVKLFPGLSESLDTEEGRGNVTSLLALLEAEPSLTGASQNFLAIARAR
jgi:hypothetical protein